VIGPFDEHACGGSADLDMWLRIARHGHLSILDEYLLAYRIGHGNDSETLHRLRTTPRRYLEIMERCVRNEARAVVSAEALLAFEGHRARDTLVRAIHHYLRGETRAARLLLDELPFRNLSRLPPPPHRAWRGWALLMRALTRLPSSSAAREVIVDGESGVLHRAGDVEDLARLTLRAAGDATWRSEIGRRARMRVREHDLDADVTAYLDQFARPTA
jgi:hypothetical protein